MAVSGKTASPHQIPYFLGTDTPPDMAAVTKAIADQVHARLNAIALSQLVTGGEANDGKLVIVKDGAAAYAAMKGDATIADDGTLTIGAGKVGTDALAAEAVTGAELAPSAVTRSKIAAGMLKTFRSAQIGLFAENASVDFPVVWNEPFPDAAYTYSVTLESKEGQADWIVVERVAKQIKVRLNAIKPGNFFIHATAIHD